MTNEQASENGSDQTAYFSVARVTEPNKVYVVGDPKLPGLSVHRVRTLSKEKVEMLLLRSLLLLGVLCPLLC